MQHKSLWLLLLKEGVKMLESYSDVLNVADVAKILKVGQRSVYKLIHSGDLYSRKIGREYKILKKDLIDYIGGIHDGIN